MLLHCSLPAVRECVVDVSSPRRQDGVMHHHIITQARALCRAASRPPPFSLCSARLGATSFPAVPRYYAVHWEQARPLLQYWYAAACIGRQMNRCRPSQQVPKAGGCPCSSGPLQVLTQMVCVPPPTPLPNVGTMTESSRERGRDSACTLASLLSSQPQQLRRTIRRTALLPRP